MATKAEIKGALIDFIDRRRSQMPLVCIVDSVDTDAMTCYCIPKNGEADIVGVRLTASGESNGFVTIPKAGSDVIVTFIDPQNAYVSMFSQIDGIRLNGDGFDGIVKVAELVEKLNNLEMAFNAHLAAYNLHTHAGVTVGAGITGITVPDTQTLTPTTQSELENITVKHGDGT